MIGIHLASSLSGLVKLLVLSTFVLPFNPKRGTGGSSFWELAEPGILLALFIASFFESAATIQPESSTGLPAIRRFQLIESVTRVPN